MSLESLRTTLEGLNVSFAVIAELLSGEIQFYGDRQMIGDPHLIEALFGDNSAIQTLNKSLEGQLLPQIWSQGKITCVVCKPTENIIVGLFHSDHRTAVEHYQWSKKADAMIRLVYTENR
ncbi:MAG: hypothetical protein KDA65_07185 [Planctomycetaceae bacterium]|nr:hypothetical protein [Planctomycetaceae bacterium]